MEDDVDIGLEDILNSLEPVLSSCHQKVQDSSAALRPILNEVHQLFLDTKPKITSSDADVLREMSNLRIEKQSAKQKKDKLEKKLEEAQKTYQDKKASLDKVRDECKAVNHQLAKTKEDIKEMQQKLKEIEQSLKKEGSDYEATYQLYQKVTSIVWDYEAPEEEIRGVVLHEHDAKPFSINLKETTKFSVANNLWDLITESQNF